MTLFDDRPRDRLGGALPGERAYAYLDGSGRPEAARLRAFLDEAFARYPAAGQAALAARIRDEDQHRGATFELLVHEWCLRVGLRVLAVEPAVPGADRTPDFLVESPAAGRFYLECVVAGGASDQALGAERRRDDVLRAIEATQTADFRLDVAVRGVPARPVAVAAYRRRLERWLAGLDPADVAAAAARGDPAPALREDLDGMRVTVRPIPRPAARRGLDGRAIGSVYEGLRSVRPWRGLRAPLIGKATRYGEPDLPLVVALDAANRDVRLAHVAEALFGSEIWAMTQDGRARVERARDGVWFGPRGPRCRALSAVLAVERLTPWSLSQRPARLYDNPWARRPAPGLDFGVGALRWRGDDPVEEAGRRLREVFGLPEGWPEDDTDDD